MRAALILALSTLSFACSSSVTIDAPEQVSAAAEAVPLRVDEIGVYTSDDSGFATHSYYVDTGTEVVVFDAQFTESLATKLLAEIRASTASPIKWVVVTHPNPDKFNGVRVFQKIGAKVVASAETARAIPGVHAYKKAFFVGQGTFTDATYPAQATVDVTFSGTFSLPLAGGESIELKTLESAGVSTTHTVAWLPKRKALVVGDLIHVGTKAE